MPEEKPVPEREEIEPVPDVRWGGRREVRVRGHLRRRLVNHLVHPPKACLCRKSKTVNKVRLGLIRRLK